MKEQRNKTTKRNMMLVMVAMLLVISLIGGTLAWLTASDSVTNTFQVTVGDVEEPKKPNDINDPSKGDTDEPLSGYIYEPEFDKLTEDEKKLSLGKTITKDPYIGIGKDSEPSYVFAWWDDNTKYKNKAGSEVEGAFRITANTTGNASGHWELVESTEDNTNNDGKSGLYVWSDNNGPIPLTAETQSAWTAVLFTNGSITVESENAQSLVDEVNTLNVYCFIHQAQGGNGDSLKSTAIEAAINAYTSNNSANN